MENSERDATLYAATLSWGCYVHVLVYKRVATYKHFDKQKHFKQIVLR